MSADNSRIKEVVNRIKEVVNWLAEWAVRAEAAILVVVVAAGSIALVRAFLRGRFELVRPLAAFVGGLSTVALAGITWIYARQTKRMAEESKKAREQAVTPMLAFDIDGDDIFVRNVGNGVATDIELQFKLTSEDSETLR